MKKPSEIASEVCGQDLREEVVMDVEMGARLGQVDALKWVVKRLKERPGENLLRRIEVRINGLQRIKP